jgi:hypothetical protein
MANSLLPPPLDNPALDKLLDVLAEHLVEAYMKELDAGPTGDDARHDCEGHE